MLFLGSVHLFGASTYEQKIWTKDDKTSNSHPVLGRGSSSSNFQDQILYIIQRVTGWFWGNSNWTTTGDQTLREILEFHKTPFMRTGEAPLLSKPWSFDKKHMTATYSLLGKLWGAYWLDQKEVVFFNIFYGTSGLLWMWFHPNLFAMQM